MALKHVRKTYDKLGLADPLYAVLSFREAKNNRWDPEEFFSRGRKEIVAALGGKADAKSVKSAVDARLKG